MGEWGYRVQLMLFKKSKVMIHLELFNILKNVKTEFSYLIWRYTGGIEVEGEFAMK